MKYLILLIFLIGCGGTGSTDKLEPTSTEPATPVGQTDNDGVVVLAKFSFEVNTTQSSVAEKAFNRIFPMAYAANPGTQTVTAVLAPSVTMTMTNTAFLIPAMSNAILDFGYLDISALNSNQLKMCGTGGNQKCSTAIFRIYTSGVSGAGFWNSDGYGAPMSAFGTTNGVVGLGQANAVTVQSFTIPSNRNTVRLSDFTPTPHFNIKGDFTDAGAGTYSTTINLEFGLM